MRKGNQGVNGTRRCTHPCAAGGLDCVADRPRARASDGQRLGRRAAVYICISTMLGAWSSSLPPSAVPVYRRPVPGAACCAWGHRVGAGTRAVRLSRQLVGIQLSAADPNAARGHRFLLPAVWGFLLWTPKPDNGAPVLDFEEKLFPKCELPHTSQLIPKRCSSRMGGIGALIWRMLAERAIPGLGG